MPANDHDNVRNIRDYQQKPAIEDPAEVLYSGGDGGTFDGMDKERLARLEGGFDGIKQSQMIIIGAVALVSALLLGSSLYLVSRVDQLGAQVSDLPGKISSDLRDLTKTLSGAITASRQTPPQVILMPAAPETASSPPKSDQKAN